MIKRPYITQVEGLDFVVIRVVVGYKSWVVDCKDDDGRRVDVFQVILSRLSRNLPPQVGGKTRRSAATAAGSIT